MDFTFEENNEKFKIRRIDNTVSITAEIECKSCGGTGIYKGMAENKGAGVICYSCKGSGHRLENIEFNIFTERKRHPKVTRVYSTAGGYGISSEDVIEPSIKFSQAGVSYEDWLQGKPPLPIKELHCPLIHYKQGTYEGELLKEKRCFPFGHILGRGLQECSKCNKDVCWAWLEKEKLFDD